MTIIIFMACNECIECCLVSYEVYAEDMYECCMHDMRYLEAIFSLFLSFISVDQNGWILFSHKVSR